MIKKIIFGTLILISPLILYAQVAPNEIPEINYCRKTSDVHDRVWEGCLYLMGELVAKQVKEYSDPSSFLKYTSDVANECRKLRKKLESESGGSFPGHVPDLLACNAENWAKVRNKIFQESYKSAPNK